MEIDLKEFAKMKRNMIIEYDNIIQSTDYGFLESILYSKYNKLTFLRMLNQNDRLYFLLNRPIKDIFSFLKNGEINENNYKNYHIDLNQNSNIYFKDIIVSEFANGLKTLLLNKSIDKLMIAVDVKNNYKLKTLDVLYHEYSDLIKICDISNIDKYIQSDEYNTIVVNNDTAYRNKEFLNSKSIMIPNMKYLWEKINVDGEEILVTKDRWEEEIELDTVFFHPFKFNKPKELKFK